MRFFALFPFPAFFLTPQVRHLAHPSDSFWVFQLSETQANQSALSLHLLYINPPQQKLEDEDLAQIGHLTVATLCQWPFESLSALRTS